MFTYNVLLAYPPVLTKTVDQSPGAVVVVVLGVDESTPIARMVVTVDPSTIGPMARGKSLHCATGVVRIKNGPNVAIRTVVDLPVQVVACRRDGEVEAIRAS